MKFDFNLELTSPEAMMGIGGGALIVIFFWLLTSGRGGPKITNNIVRIKDSPGAKADIDQSRSTNVNVNTNVAVAVGRMPSPLSPEREPRTPNRPVSNSGQDDAGAIIMALLVALFFVGYFYLRYFEPVTFISRTFCFTAASYALLGCALDIYRRGFIFDEIQFGYLLPGLVCGAAAGLLLQAQDLISPEMVEAAASEQGILNFVLNRLTNAGRLYLIASLTSTTVIFFVSIAAFLAILRALVLSGTEAESHSWLTRVFIRATEWVKPTPFSILSVFLLGFVTFILYFWLPNIISK